MIRTIMGGFIIVRKRRPYIFLVSKDDVLISRTFSKE